MLNLGAVKHLESAIISTIKKTVTSVPALICNHTKRRGCVLPLDGTSSACLYLTLPYRACVKYATMEEQLPNALLIPCIVFYKPVTIQYTDSLGLKKIGLWQKWSY